MEKIPQFHDYQGAEEWLLSITDFERLLGSPAVQYNTHTFDLDRFRAQLRHLGDPHLRYGTIHVAGTKGKGSSCAFLESALRACGLKTGLYTSPHLYKFTERIRVNGNEIPDGEFARLIHTMGQRMAASAEPSDQRNAGFRTVFEILTAAAFQYFAEQGVEVAIIETGLGGRLDSTNMFDDPARPLVNVITAIGLDHTSILGTTTAAIAGEKAAIIRPHSRVVVAPQVDPATTTTVHEVVSSRCSEVSANPPVFAAESIAIEPRGIDSYCFKFRETSPAPRDDQQHTNDLRAALQQGLKIRPALHGAHQAKNLSAVLIALMLYEDELRRTGKLNFTLPVSSVIKGLENTAWPGRFQEIELDGAQFIIDGAHCAISAAALGQACRQRFGDQPAVVVVGFLRDKAGDEILDGIFEQVPVKHAIGIIPPTPRAIAGDAIETALQKHLASASAVEMATSIDDALSRAKTAARRLHAYVIVYGSLYLVGPALQALGKNAK